MIKVLIVEDELHTRRGLSMFVPWNSMECVLIGEAANAIEGEKMILELKPDIAIVDICMPGVSGLEMIKKLKDKTQTEYIILSGYSEFEYARDAIDLEVVGYLLKPVDEEELKQTVLAACRKLQKKRKLERLEQDTRYDTEGHSAAIRDILLPEGFHTKDALVEKALKIIDEQCGQNLSLEAVAEQLNISESYLGKLFKKKLGYTFMEVRTACRMQKAVQMLLETDLRIYEIADRLGYRDIRHFSTVFRSMVGVNPTEFRNRK